MVKLFKNNKINRIIDDVIAFIWVYVVIALPPLSLIYLMKLFSLETDFFSSSSARTIDFPTLIILFLFLPALGSALSIWRKKIRLLFFWQLEKQALIHIAFVSLLLSFVLWQFYAIFSILSYFGLFILFSFFLLYLPISARFLGSVDFNKLKNFLIPASNMSNLRLAERILYIFVILLFIHSLVIMTDGKIRKYNHYQLFLSRHPRIEVVKPQIVYYDTKVVLLGRGFGWKGKIDTKFKYQEGKIDISLWTDTKVIFTVPLHWKTGDLSIWLQKPIEWDGKNMMVNSNNVKLRLISRDDGWDKDDDAYFEQLKHLDKEVLKINGYK
jgi:hypothetical protein